jgi:hypothetical protein
MQPNKLTFHIPVLFVEWFTKIARNVFENFIEDYIIESMMLYHKNDSESQIGRFTHFCFCSDAELLWTNALLSYVL